MVLAQGWKTSLASISTPGGVSVEFKAKPEGRKKAKRIKAFAKVKKEERREGQGTTWRMFRKSRPDESDHLVWSP